MPTNQPKIFISHAWEDKPLVQRLEKVLQAAGAKVWVDHEGIRGGDNLPKRISDALAWCDTLLLVWSKSASKSHWVELEWSNAISLKRTIFPCCVDNATLPAILAHKAYVPFSDIETRIVQLLQDLRLSKPSPSVNSEQVLQPSPRVSHSTLQEALRPTVITKPLVGTALRLRSTPTILSESDVKAMLRKYDFFCYEYEWSKDWSNPQGKGIDHKFTIRQNGEMVFDHATGLMWQQGGSSESISFLEAEKYVRDSNARRFAGFNDWRLPTLEEAMSLVEREENTDGMYIDPIFDRAQWWIWTTDKSSASSCWAVLVLGGSCGHHHLSYGSYVRLVR